MGMYLSDPTADDRNAKKSLKPFRDDVFLGIALGATDPHRIEKLIPPVITNTREWLLYMAGTDLGALKGFYDKNGSGRGDQIGDKETVLSWRANRRSELEGLQVTVTGSGLSGKELSVDVLNGTNADQYINALSGNGINLTDPVVLNIGVYDNGVPYMYEDLTMSISYTGGAYGIRSSYRIDGDPSVRLPKIETLISSHVAIDVFYIDNPFYPAAYVIDREALSK